MNASIYFTKQQARDPHLLVVGGGPAGSSFALFALDYAQRAGMDLQVTIFEPRDFTRPGPWGCNMGAGLIPVRMLQHLAEIDVTVPPHVIRNHINSYTLHTAAGQIHLPQPDPVGDVIGVYRGNGPRNGPDWGTCISFDHFLLQAAQERGAQVIHERVTHISLSPHTFVATREGRYTGSLVVLATGVNSGGLETEGLDYQPPRRSKMAQVELFLGEELVEERLQGSVHIVLPQNNQLKFGTLVPKGPCINVSLLGGDLPSGSVERFLQLPEVRSVLPEGVQNRACGCRPYISVGAARPLYADRFVAIGDAGITRLYKNGIGTGLRTARRAAFTAINFGTTEAAFHAHYGPLCREIARDNLAGRFLFSFTHLFQNHHWFALPQIESIAAEQNLPPVKRLHSRLLWGMFTGAYTYTQLLMMALHPRLQGRILRYLATPWRRPPANQWSRVHAAGQNKQDVLY